MNKYGWDEKTTFSPHQYAESISAWSNQGSVIQSF